MADLFLSFFGNVEVECSVTFAVGIVGVVYGVKERRLRLRKTASMEQKNRELEARLDPQRSSSRLTNDGRTSPEDKR